VLKNKYVGCEEIKRVLSFRVAEQLNHKKAHDQFLDRELGKSDTDSRALALDNNSLRSRAAACRTSKHVASCAQRSRGYCDRTRAA
jgi:hypothetical protein